MKIVQFIHALSSGGAETMVKDYVLALKERGHDVCVVVLEVNNNWPNESAVRNADIDVFCIGGKNTGNGYVSRIVRKAVRALFTPWLLPALRLKILISRIKPDVIHSHIFVMQYLYLIRNDLKDIKLIYTCHNEVVRIFSGKSRDGKFNAKSVKWFNERGKVRIIALHSRMAQDIYSFFHTSAVVLYNPVNLIKFNSLRNASLVRKELGIPEKAFVVGHVGRFSYQKNHEWIVEVFSECYKRDPETYLLLIGSGSKMGFIEKQLHEAKLDGHYLILSDRNDVPDLDNAMDVFLLPSFYEGFPISLIEAQAVGLKCVISDRITPDAVLTDNVCMLSLNESAETWSKAILTNEFKPVRPAHNLEDFDINRVVDKLIQIYSE